MMQNNGNFRNFISLSIIFMSMVTMIAEMWKYFLLISKTFKEISTKIARRLSFNKNPLEKSFFQRKFVLIHRNVN